jgi:Flp pilus assembly protein TadG
MSKRLRCDDGSAIVEFVWLAILLMIPLVYVVLSALSVQRASFAATSAVRDAARAYATAGSDGEGEARAEQAVALAMHDQGVDWTPAGRVIACGECAFEPGSTFTVDIHTTVKLPFVPVWLCGERCIAGIPVSAHHRERIDCFAGTGSIAAGAMC